MGKILEKRYKNLLLNKNLDKTGIKSSFIGLSHLMTLQIWTAVVGRARVEPQGMGGWQAVGKLGGWVVICGWWAGGEPQWQVTGGMGSGTSCGGGQEDDEP